ncbi:hypothetical protein D3C81_981220 [compost metagenome]
MEPSNWLMGDSRRFHRSLAAGYSSLFLEQKIFFKATIRAYRNLASMVYTFSSSSNSRALKNQFDFWRKKITIPFGLAIGDRYNYSDLMRISNRQIFYFPPNRTVSLQRGNLRGFTH